MKAKLKILHLEDSPTDADLVGIALRKELVDVEVLVVDNQKDYEKALYEFSPDLILSDHSLPSFNSIEAFKIFKQSKLQIPFILVTATVSEYFAVRAIKSGVDDYILKDNLTRLPSAIEHALELFKVEIEKQTLLNRITDNVISLDLEWRYTFMNDLALATHPLGREKTIGKVIWDIHPEMKGTIFWDKYHEAIDTQKVVEVESYYAPMKTWFHLKAYPSSEGLTIFYEDITERKITQAIIAQNEKRFRALIENSTDGLTVISVEGIVVEMSPSGRKILGYNESEIIGKNRPDLIHPDDRNTVMDAFKQIIAYPANIKILEYRHKMPDGSDKWLECTFHNLLSEPNINAIILNYRDITERKKAENILSESENKYRNLFNNNPAPMLIWDFETHQIIDCNQEALIKYEYSREEFLNLKIEDIGPEEDIYLIRQATQTEKTYGEIHKNIWRHKKKNGEIMFMDISGHLIDHHNRRAALIMLIDVTEKFKTEETIRRSEAELREAQKLAQVGSWNFDFKADHLTWSDELYNIFDTNHKTFLETHGSFIHLVDEPYRDFVRQTSLYAQKDGTPFDIEYKITTAKGEKRVIHERGYAERNQKGKIIRLFGTAQNITERKKAEEQIRTEKFFSDFLINSLPGIFYLYDQDGKFARWNKNFETVSGYSATEISQMHPFDFYDADEKKLIQKIIETVFTSGSDEVTAHFYTKDKKKIPYYFNGHKISLNGNNYLIGVGIDVTERVRAEQELVAYTQEIKKLTAHLEQVREEERTRIAREIHDELGQQLTGLKMDASWLSKKIGRNEKSLQEKLAGMILLMDNTVKTIRRISSDLRPGILDDLGLVAALEWQSNEFQKRTETRCIFKSKVDDLNIDRNLATGVFRIYQETLTNVMRHAKATRVETSLVNTKTHIVLTIEDNGQGFDTSAAKMKESLGLVGMRERASMLGITLNIVSGTGSGTSVILKIPLTLNTFTS